MLHNQTNKHEMKYLALIPARYASTRFPGKPLAVLGGKLVVQRVYEQARLAFDDVYVCTDDERIFSAVEAFGGKAVMTDSGLRSGTDRCWQACERIGTDADVIVNIQGDEPFVQKSQLEGLKDCFQDGHTQIATLVRPFSGNDTFEELSNPNSPKVVVDKNMRALYFSRSVIPYLRGVGQRDWLSCHTFYKHIGLYAYRREALRQISRLAPGVLEKAESLEQLRWLENGLVIKVALTDTETVGIDTPADLQRAELYLKSKKIQL